MGPPRHRKTPFFLRLISRSNRGTFPIPRRPYIDPLHRSHQRIFILIIGVSGTRAIRLSVNALELWPARSKIVAHLADSCAIRFVLHLRTLASEAKTTHSP